MGKLIELDDKQLSIWLNGADNLINSAAKDAQEEMADTLLILSSYEVPHDEGTLQSSGHVGHDKDDVYVAYNTEYARYQHEGIRKDGTHRIIHYQKGRKSKYLEDPLKHNISKWQEIARKNLNLKLKQ